MERGKLNYCAVLLLLLIIGNCQYVFSQKSIEKELFYNIIDVTVNPGNVHDSVAFDGLYDRMTEKHPEIKAVVMDAGFKTPWICKKVL